MRTEQEVREQHAFYMEELERMRGMGMSPKNDRDREAMREMYAWLGALEWVLDLRDDMTIGTKRRVDIPPIVEKENIDLLEATKRMDEVLSKWTSGHRVSEIKSVEVHKGLGKVDPVEEERLRKRLEEIKNGKHDDPARMEELLSGHGEGPDSTEQSGK